MPRGMKSVQNGTKLGTGQDKPLRPIGIRPSYYERVRQLADREGRMISRQLELVIDAGLSILDPKK